jgi:hypothetical protein
MRRRKLRMEGCDRDIREHMEMKTQDNLGRGMSPVDPLRQLARVIFGRRSGLVG